MKQNNNTSIMKILGILFILFVTIISCSKESIPSQPQVLTDEVISALSAITDRVFLETSTPALIASISVDGEPDLIIKRGIGNLTTNEPVNEKNSFRIASITKTFAGTAVLILADEGAIAFDQSISYYLPEYNIPSGNLITIRMLGNMTSGLYNYSEDISFWESFREGNYQKYFPPDSLLAIAFRHPMNFTPGTEYEYCNTNTVLLGLLLEKVSKKSAYQVIREKVIQPLNLNNTYFGGPFYMYTPYSHGYVFEDEGLIDATNWNPSWGYTAGGLISNIEDLKKWAPLLANGALLSEAMKAERFKFNNGYGFCIESIRYKNDLWIGHPGSIPGYNTQVWYNRARKITLVVNSNTDSESPAQTLLIDFIILLGDLNSHTHS
jgi:D-alanyl-D-alanine carboxypeptidase